MEIFQFDEIDNILRRIARRDKWQTLYSLAKEKISNTQIFENNINYTYYQMEFFGHLAFYSSIYYDIATGEVSDMVLDNWIYEDAWIHYRTQKRLGKTKRKGRFMDNQHGTVVTQTGKHKEEITNKNVWSFTSVKGRK